MKEILSAMAVNTRELLWKIEELKDKARNLETGDNTTEKIVSKLREGTSVLVNFSELVEEVEELIEKFKD